MTEPTRVDVSVTPIMRDGVMVGAAAGAHVVMIPPNMDDAVPWLSWLPDGMGSMIARHRGCMVTVGACRGGYRLVIDTLGPHASQTTVYTAPGLPEAAALLREVFR